jgi:hypothetical protein
MKYIKEFNESYISDSLKEVEKKIHQRKVDDIKRFCNENLAYLIDSGFSIRYFEYGKNDIGDGIDTLNVNFHKNGKLFKWEEVVDDVVPFLQVINTKYGLVKLKSTSNRDKYSKKCTVMFADYKYFYKYTLSDLVNDITTGIVDKEFNYISFSVKI